MRNILLLLCFSLWHFAHGQEWLEDCSYVRPLFDFNEQKPLFAFNEEQLANENRYLRYYALTGYREGVFTTTGSFGLSFSTVDDKDSGTRLLYMYNVSIGEMVTHRVGNPDWVVYEVKDPSRYRYLPAYGPREAWLRKNGLCFEMMLPSASMDVGLVDTLLSSRLGLTWRWEKREMKALVLFRLSKAEKFSCGNTAISGAQGNKKFTGMGFDGLGKALSVEGRPFIDQTGYSGLVDIVLEVKDPKDLAGINRQLRQYDLAVKEELRELNMFVIKEKKKTEKE